MSDDPLKQARTALYRAVQDIELAILYLRSGRTESGMNVLRQGADRARDEWKITRPDRAATRGEG
jgi:hypothetical protein